MDAHELTEWSAFFVLEQSGLKGKKQSPEELGEALKGLAKVKKRKDKPERKKK